MHQGSWAVMTQNKQEVFFYCNLLTTIVREKTMKDDFEFIAKTKTTQKQTSRALYERWKDKTNVNNFYSWIKMMSYFTLLNSKLFEEEAWS